MKSIKKIMASLVAGAVAVAGICVILPACNSDGSINGDAVTSALETGINAVATALSNSDNLTAAVTAAQNSGYIDSSTASLISAAIPIVASLSDSVADATATTSTSTDTASKNAVGAKKLAKARSLKEISVLQSKFEEILKANSSKINANNLQAALTAIAEANAKAKGLK